MATKTTLAFCAIAILIQSALSASLGGCGCGCGCGCGGGIGGGRGISSSGGQFRVESSSRAPTGISVESQNQYEGQLCLNGQLPFLGTVGLQGCLDSCGSGSVCYGCGNGNLGISEKRGCGCGCGGR